MNTSPLFSENPGIIALEQAEPILDPHLPLVRKCIEAPLREWKAVCQREPLFIHNMDNRAKANVINSHIVATVEKKFAKVKGVRITRDNGFLVLIIGERLVVRFKKLDAKLRARNYMTNQQRKIYYQEDLPGLPPGATVVVAGYRLDPAGLHLSDVHVVCPVGRRNKWALSLLDGAERTLRLPAAITPPQRAVVKAKGGVRTRKSEAQ
jgi:hypothetical protein